MAVFYRQIKAGQLTENRDGQDIVHENPEQKYLNANKIIEIQKLTENHRD
jgi:hypothetical protein